jgi:hypothetical protein
MSQPRTRLALESLEARENPATLFTETFDTLATPALPQGWATWSNDNTATFTTATTATANNVLVSEAGSRTAARAWHPEAVSANTGAAVSVNVNSLVPAYVFARGTNVNASNGSYLAAVVTRGLRVQLLEVNGSLTRVLGTVSSPSSAFFSNGWVRVSLVPEGTTAKVEVTRQDTGQYLNSAGTWQTAATTAIAGTTTLTAARGQIGIGRNGLYFGAVQFDNFSAIGDAPVSPPPAPPVVLPPPPAPPVSPPVSPPAPPVSPPPATSGSFTQSFDTTAIGSAPTGWNAWANDSTSFFRAATTRSLSPANSFASSGFSSSNARAWVNSDLPADVDVSAAIYSDSLITAQVFARGTGLQSATPTFYAVNLIRGLDAKLVKVVNGVETTLASIKSTAYLSGQWIRTRLIAEGDRLRVQLYRTDTRQWLTPDGSWSDSPDFALEVRDSSITGSGRAGVARKAGSSGLLSIDDFEAKPAGAQSGPQVAITRVDGSGAVTGEVTFRATITGAFNRVEFRLNNLVRAVSATSPAEWTFDSTTVLNGNYTLTVRAFDNSGNVGSQDFAFSVSNPNMDPLPDPTIPRHYSHIRIAQLAYSGTPITNSFEQNLLRNSVDLVIPNPQFLNAIQSASPDTPQLIYSNVSNLYQGLLTDWLRYADTHNAPRELAFYHVTKPTAFQGASPSSQPVTWFWGVHQSTGTGTPTDVTSAARAGRNFNVQFGAAGTTTAISFVEKFREMNITLVRGASAGWEGVWEYATATDASGNATAWRTLTLNSDATGGLRSSGRITFDPPSDWVPSSPTPGAAPLYAVRFRVTAGTTASGPELRTIFGRDYVNANGGQTGTIPPFDYSADTNGDGYLNDAEYANRQAGHDARFVYESRLFYPYYGQMRFVTNPSSAAVRHWAAEYHERLLNANSLADGIFMDNATGKVPFLGVSVLEPTATFSEDSGALMNAVSRAISPKWVMSNTAGGATTADPITAASGGVFEEFLIRPMSANWSEVGDAVALANRRLNTDGNPFVIIDSSPEGGTRHDARTQMGTLAYYYLLADPNRTFLMFFGGDSPSTSWTEHWSPAVNVNVGAPTSVMKVFATGTDPANAALTYQVLAREYQNALVLHKPLSYAQGRGEGTTADNTATTHQLNGTYRVVNSNGTLGQFVTSITLRNGEGAILVRA